MNWSTVFLGIIAVAMLTTAIVQVSVLIAAGRITRRLDRIASQVEREISPLIASLNAATNSLAIGDVVTAESQLQAFLNKVDQMVKTGKLTAAQGAALTELAQRIIASI